MVHRRQLCPFAAHRGREAQEDIRRKTGKHTNAPLDELAEAGQRPVGELGHLGVALVDLHLLVVQPVQRHRLVIMFMLTLALAATVVFVICEWFFSFSFFFFFLASQHHDPTTKEDSTPLPTHGRTNDPPTDPLTHPHVILMGAVDPRGREVKEAGVPGRALHLQAGIEQQLPLRLEPVVVRLDALHHVLFYFFVLWWRVWAWV